MAELDSQLDDPDIRTPRHLSFLRSAELLVVREDVDRIAERWAAAEPDLRFYELLSRDRQRGAMKPVVPLAASTKSFTYHWLSFALAPTQTSVRVHREEGEWRAASPDYPNGYIRCETEPTRSSRGYHPGPLHLEPSDFVVRGSKFIPSQLRWARRLLGMAARQVTGAAQAHRYPSMEKLPDPLPYRVGLHVVEWAREQPDRFLYARMDSPTEGVVWRPLPA